MQYNITEKILMLEVVFKSVSYGNNTDQLKYIREVPGVDIRLFME